MSNNFYNEEIKNEIDKLMVDLVKTFYHKLENLIYGVFEDMNINPYLKRSECAINVYPFSKEYIHKVGVKYDGEEIATLTMIYDEEDENDPKFLIIPESKFHKENG